MARLSQPMPCSEIKIIPIFGTVSKFRIFQNLNTLPVDAQSWQALLPTALAFAGSSGNGELTVFKASVRSFSFPLF